VAWKSRAIENIRLENAGIIFPIEAPVKKNIPLLFLIGRNHLMSLFLQQTTVITCFGCFAIMFDTTTDESVLSRACPRAGVYDRPDAPSACSFLTNAIPDAGVREVTAGEVVTHRCVTFHFVVDLFAIEASKTLVSITFDFDSRRLIANVNTGRLPDAGPAVVEIAGTKLKAAAGAVLESVRAKACRQIRVVCR
jgi:hypothetical protein